MEQAKPNFTDFPPCRHRFGCIQCRNDIKFVEHMKERYGSWECPENIPFGTPLEEMPDHIKAKLGKYQKTLKAEGRELPVTTAEDQIGVPTPPTTPKKPSFTETPGCTHRMMCVDCRNNEKFREKVEIQLGSWECPENIPIGTPLEEMPENIRVAAQKREDQIQLQKEKMDKVRIALDGIEEVIPEQALGLIDLVRAHVFPNTKKGSLCKFNTGDAKKIEQKCCGGKIKMVDGFTCEKKGNASERICGSCQEFESKR